MQHFDILIIGGGAAGFFTAINAAELKPDRKIAILERGKEVLGKVKVSGGGRCNITHAEFLPKELTSNYPRGEKELLGPFHKFMTGDTLEWFEKRGVELKIEEDGRIFPVSDNSQSIINCFLQETEKLKIQVLKSYAVKTFQPREDYWVVTTNKEEFSAEKIMLATGSNPKIWDSLKKLGHRIIEPVPSLFTFNIQDPRIIDLPGIATEAEVKIETNKGILASKGPLLITHWGMSGPGILKLSAWGARDLKKMNYQFNIKVNWLPGVSSEEILERLKDLKENSAKQKVLKNKQFNLPKRLWKNLVIASGVVEGTSWADLNKKQLLQLNGHLTNSDFEVNGKSTFKEEFVTAGGLDLREVNFKTFESKLFQNLFLAGEVLNIDAITGGFNFQNAWTGGYIAAQAMSKD